MAIKKIARKETITSENVKENAMKKNLISLIPNEKKKGMEMHIKGYVSQEQFKAFRDMGWNYTNKFDKPYGRYFASFEAHLWNDTAELINSGAIEVLDKKPEPIRDYTKKPTIVELGKTIELRGVRRIEDEDLDLELIGLGWNYQPKGGYYTASYSKRRIAKTKQLLGLEPSSEKKAAAKSDSSKQIAMPLAQLGLAVGEDAMDIFYQTQKAYAK